MEWLGKIMTAVFAGFLLLLAMSCVLMVWEWLGSLGSRRPRQGEDPQTILDELDNIDDDESTRREIKRLKRRLHRLEQAMDKEGKS